MNWELFCTFYLLIKAVKFILEFNLIKFMVFLFQYLCIVASHLLYLQLSLNPNLFINFWTVFLVYVISILVYLYSILQCSNSLGRETITRMSWNYQVQFFLETMDSTIFYHLSYNMSHEYHSKSYYLFLIAVVNFKEYYLKLFLNLWS